VYCRPTVGWVAQCSGLKQEYPPPHCGEKNKIRFFKIILCSAAQFCCNIWALWFCFIDLETTSNRRFKQEYPPYAMLGTICLLSDALNRFQPISIALNRFWHHILAYYRCRLVRQFRDSMTDIDCPLIWPLTCRTYVTSLARTVI